METEEKKGFFEILKGLYVNKYKQLLFIPFGLLLLALIQLFAQYAVTGDFVHKGISLQGGVTVTIPDRSTDIIALQNALQNAFPEGDIIVRRLTQTKGIVVDASDVVLDELVNQLQGAFSGLTIEEYSVEQIGSSLGKSFFREIFIAIILAFIFMGIVVFITFRTLVPSMAVILAAFSDIVVTLAIFNLIGMKLSTAGVAAFLMLIGYSVDTDILLSSHLLKRKEGGMWVRLHSAFKTGIMMSVTTIAAITVSLIFSRSETITQIMLILLIGLLVDIIMTWIQNAGLLRWHLEKKHGHD